jgi:hypothetical protein
VPVPRGNARFPRPDPHPTGLIIAIRQGAFQGNPQESALLSIIKVFDDLSLGFI